MTLRYAHEHADKELKDSELWCFDSVFSLSLLLRFYAIDCYYSTNHLNEIKKISSFHPQQ